MYISYNDALRFELNNYGDLSSFDLIRIKYNIDIEMPPPMQQVEYMTYTEDWMSKKCAIHVPGELLDVSFSTPQDMKMKELKGMKINEWTSYNPDTGLRTPSFEYLITKDIPYMFFSENKFPWDDAKYDKRLKRYIFGLVILNIPSSQSNEQSYQNEFQSDVDQRDDLLADIGALEEWLSHIINKINNKENNYYNNNNNINNDNSNVRSPHFIKFQKNIENVCKRPKLDKTKLKLFVNNCNVYLQKIAVIMETYFLHNKNIAIFNV